MYGVRQGPDFIIFSMDAHLSPNQFSKSKPLPYGLKAVSEDACVSVSFSVSQEQICLYFCQLHIVLMSIAYLNTYLLRKTLPKHKHTSFFLKVAGPLHVNFVTCQIQFLHGILQNRITFRGNW